MARGIDVVADEAVTRARTVRGLLVGYVAALVLLTRSHEIGPGHVAAGLLGLACFVAAIRALRHCYRHGRREGQTASYVALFATTGFLGLLVAIALRPNKGV